MIDSREIQVLDNSFELSETIAQNEQLIKTNRQLIYFGLTVALLLTGAILFIVNNKPREDSAKETI